MTDRSTTRHIGPINPPGALPAGDWLRRTHPGTAETDRDRSTMPLLVCLPHAGGSAGYFRPLAALLADDAEVLAVQYPGRQDRLRHHHPGTIDGLATGVTAGLAPLRHRRLVVFGHSMGAAVAFETVRRLEAEGGPGPVALAVSGRRAPGAWRAPRSVHRSDDAIIAEFADLGGTDSRLLDDPETAELFLPAARADYTAIESWDPEPGARVGCPTTALLGDDDPQSTIAEAERWAAHTSADFALTVFPGGHFYLDDHLPAVSHVLRRLLQSGPTDEGNR